MNSIRWLKQSQSQRQPALDTPKKKKKKIAGNISNKLGSWNICAYYNEQQMFAEGGATHGYGYLQVTFTPNTIWFKYRDSSSDSSSFKRLLMTIFTLF